MKNWERWEEYNYEWFLYKMEKTSQAFWPNDLYSYNNPCITCSWCNCNFCPIVNNG